MICGSCGMRMDGGAVLACKVRMYDIAQEGRVPVISAMGNLPIVKDLVVDMDPFWQKMRAVDPYLQPRYDQAQERENVVPQAQMDVIHKESLCINCGCCVSECNSMESDPDFLGPAALAKGMRFVGDPRDGATIERLEKYSEPHGLWDCTRCYFCNERCPKGVDPRDAIAKLGAEAMKNGIDRDMGAKHAKWFVTSAKTTGWLRETELVPKTQGIVSSIKEMKFAMGLAVKGKVPPPFPPHVAAEVHESRALFDLVKTQGRDGAAGIVQGEKALGRIESHHEASEGRDPYTEADSAPRPFLPERARRDRGGHTREEARLLQGLPGVALGEGARHLDPRARAEGGLRADRARVGHMLRRRRHPRGRARLLPAPERADPLLRRGDGLRHADDGVQRLHAQPAPGQPPAADRRGPARARQRQPRAGRRAAATRGTVEVKHFLWLIAGESFGTLQTVAHKGLKGLKIAPFYGCQILRPSKLMGFEDPDKPSSLERIIEACGGEAIDYPAKIKCCGFPIIQAREDTALAELIQPIEQAMEAGADAMVTPCPLCHLSLDAWQSKLKKQTGKDFAMPILHLSQLVGVAAGLTDSELKFKRHVVSVDPVIEKLSV